MKVHQQPSAVLRTRPYRESSLLIDAFSREHGRLMVIAKGARRQKSPLRGILQPFQMMLLSWSGKGQLPVLTGAEVTDYHKIPRRDAAQSSYYINELLLKFLHRFDPHPELFDFYVEALENLRLHSNESAVLRVFEKKLLQEIGFGLILDHDCETGEAIDQNVEYQYLQDRGPVADASAVDSGIRVSGATLRALEHEKLENGHVLKQARTLTRSLIQYQLGSRRILTRNVMIQIRNYMREYGGASGS